ncbi:hypothetical protein AAFF_G00377970 [Aldrovandia affinis]|uniref:Uncharacterized protein n=1 Tax=Aldrovandia affinis TaxID=143900 RepID=A0AAD7SI17_9TELE|nr:hypothetical protein AAFF_G00377970 [Aldrovandia affinis]
MDNLSEFGSLCPSSRRDWDTSSCVDDLLDEDEKDRAKRASRNKSEKKRRDQFNVLIKELCTMLQGQGHPRKMDKSTILQRTIDFLQKQREITAQTESCEIRQDWKPSFLCNEEFTQLMLEALDGFLIALTTDGNIIYVSDSVSSLIGHLPSDMVDQNILNFLPEREHGEVYKLLSSHMLMTDPITADFLENETHIEFCCHLARGNIDPKEPATYEYVKFVGDFKFHNNVPTSSCNGFELALPRTLQSSPEEQVCLVATVRLVTPQFLKDLCNVEDPCDEFTSRHSLEWKFLFLDHRASPIIGYLPFEVLGTSGYDYYHVDDLELIAQCHKQLMQFGKGKSCYYRFLTKGQQWIWLQTHYYITYHQWNSKPEFIVCTHTVVSYAEVRAERRRELGLEETEMASSSIKLQGPEVYPDIAPPPEGPTPKDPVSGTRSVSSHSSRKSSHTAMSDSASNSSVRHTESSQPPPARPEKASSRIQPSSSKTLVQRQNSSDVLPQPSIPLSPTCSQHSIMPPVYEFQEPQLGVMHQLKEQLEERTRILQNDIKTQQQELHDIKEQLQLVTSSNIQMLLQQPIPTGFNQVQQPQQQQQGPGRPAQQSQSGVIRQASQQTLCGPHSSSPHSLLREANTSSPQVQQRLIRSASMQAVSLPVQTHASLTMPLYSNPMMFSQTSARPLQMPQDISQRHTGTDFSQEGQLRMLLNQPMQALMTDSGGSSQASQCNTAMQQTKYTLEQQMVTPMQQVNCNAVLVPSPVFSSPIMIPHNSFITHQAQPAYHPQPQATQHSLQLQQPHQFFQMQPQGLLHSGQTQSLFQATHISRKHYLSLWNNEDPHGRLWIPCISPTEVVLDVSRMILLSDLESVFGRSHHHLPLLVRIMHKSRLRFYGKFDTKIDIPFQAYFEVADQSGSMSMVLWNALCPEWYQSLNVGTVIYLQNYTLKQSYQNRSRPILADPQMKAFTAVEIGLNPRSPTAIIDVVPPKSVKPQWGLPDILYKFITRSELDSLPNNSTCDVIGLVTFVGRCERIRSKGNTALEKYWTYRWVHALDGTSDSPFVLEIFASSQPEIFSEIYPMTYLVCTQMRVCRQEDSMMAYLTSSCETQIFTTGFHKGQTYVSDPTVKSFIQWTKTLKDNVMLRKTVIGGHYCFPPSPPVFTETIADGATEVPVVAASELQKELECLQYREHKRLAFQGQITAVQYVPWPEEDQASGQPAEQVSVSPDTSLSQRANVVTGSLPPVDHGAETVTKTWADSDAEAASTGLRPHKRRKDQHGESVEVCTEEERRDSEPEEEPQLGGPGCSGADGTHHPTGALLSTTAPEERLVGDCPYASWESSAWAELRSDLLQHFHFDSLQSESIARKFSFEDKDYLLQQNNLHPAKWTPDEFHPDQNLNKYTPVTCKGYFKITILGVNQQTAIDAVFVPVLSSEDPRSIGVPRDPHDNTLLSCLSTGFVSPLKNPMEEDLPIHPDPGEIVQTATELEGMHVVCLIDFCHLGGQKMEVVISKMYTMKDIASV